VFEGPLLALEGGEGPILGLGGGGELRPAEPGITLVCTSASIETENPKSLSSLLNLSLLSF